MSESEQSTEKMVLYVPAVKRTLVEASKLTAGKGQH